MSFLDRVNIGAAKLYGFMEDLGLDSHKYTIASMIFVSAHPSHRPAGRRRASRPPARPLGALGHGATPAPPPPPAVAPPGRHPEPAQARC